MTITLDWRMEEGQPVVEGGQFHVLNFLPELPYLNACQVAKELLRASGHGRHGKYLYYRQGPRISFTDVPLADLRRAIEIANVAWDTFKCAFRWRLVTLKVPPEPRR